MHGAGNGLGEDVTNGAAARSVFCRQGRRIKESPRGGRRLFFFGQDEGGDEPEGADS